MKWVWSLVSCCLQCVFNMSVAPPQGGQGVCLEIKGGVLQLFNIQTMTPIRTQLLSDIKVFAIGRDNDRYATEQCVCSRVAMETYFFSGISATSPITVMLIRASVMSSV